MQTQIIILAAGKGSRMKSDLPKVMHEIAGKPMIEHVIDHCSQATDDLVLVYSSHLEPYLEQFESKVTPALQEEQKGTAHATAVAKENYAKDAYIGVIYGDNPLITPDIISGLFEYTKESGSAVVTLAFDYDKPNAYGKIVTDVDGNFLKIVESKFANPDEQKITLCNSGIMAFAPGILEKYIDKCLVPNPDIPGREFYLTDIVEICKKAGEKVSYYKSGFRNQVVGINTQEELEAASKLILQL